MRTFLMLLAGLVVFWSTEAQDESSACWSSAVCYKAGNSEMEWLEIYSQPNCISKSNIPKIVEYTRIQQKFNRSIVEFFKGLGSFATKACSSCNLYEVIEVGGSGHTYSDTEECFAPVVCAVDGRTIADFVQIRPFPSCNPGKKLHETSGEMESLFNSSREYVVKELKYFLYKNCNLCQTTRMENALATLTKSLWQPSIDTTQCYAPVICDDGDNSFKNWMKFPDIDCKAAKLTLLSEKPEKIFTSILERARAEIQNIVEEECSKSCDEKSSFSTSTFEAEHTTPEILQRALASTKSDKETTSVALESMLQTSTTSESMLQTSATSLKTTLGNLVRKFENPVQSALQRVNVSKEQILSNISDFYQYTYDSSDNMKISDGGGDMYDDGNKVYIMADGETTNIVYERYYERGDYEFSSSMGWPFTALMYINNTDGARSFYSMQVTSNAGADRSGALVYFNGSLISCGVNVTYFVTQVCNAGDPSICEVYYAFGAGEASEDTFNADKRSRNTDVLDTVLSLGGYPQNAWMGYMLLSRKAGVMIGESEVRESVKRITGAVLDCQDKYCHVNNITCLNGGTCSIQDGTSYTCKCSPGYYGRSCGKILKVSAPRKLLSVSGDKRLLIAVNVVTSHGRVNLRIYRENGTGNAIQTFKNIGNGIVHFQLTGITREAEGTYKILAESVVDRHTSISTVYITVHEKAELSEITYPFTYTPTETEKDRIICRATGVPLPVVSWYRNSSIVRSDQSGRGVFQTKMRGHNNKAAAILHVGEAKLSDNGTYVCKATNRVGPDNQLTVNEALAELAVYGAPRINNISSVRLKACTSTVDVLWTPNNQTNDVIHRVTMQSQNPLIPHNVTVMTMSGRVLLKDLHPFTAYQLQISVCPDICISKLNTTKEFTTEVKLPDEVKNPTLTSDDCSSSCTVTWDWTEKAGSERIKHTEVMWVQKANGSLALEENGRAKVRWPVTSYLIPTFTRSDNDFTVFLQVASCAGMSKSVIASGSCRPTGNCVNAWMVTLGTATAISATAALIFGILLLLKTRKQTAPIITESTAIPCAAFDDSCERARYVIEEHIEENPYEEFEGQSAPPEENPYENH